LEELLFILRPFILTLYILGSHRPKRFLSFHLQG
jgi:hypothetical protein